MRSEPGRSIGCPASRIEPSTGCMKPAIALSRVDLPQPDGPSSTKRSLANTSKPTRQVAVTRWSTVLYCSVTSSTASSGPPLLPAARPVASPRAMFIPVFLAGRARLLASLSGGVSSPQEKTDDWEEPHASHSCNCGSHRLCPCARCGARRGEDAARRQAIRRRLHAVHGPGGPEADREARQGRGARRHYRRVQSVP